MLHLMTVCNFLFMCNPVKFFLGFSEVLNWVFAGASIHREGARVQISCGG